MYTDQDRESDSFHFYGNNGNLFSDLFNEELNRIPSHDSPSKETAETEADNIILNFVRKAGRLWFHLGEMAGFIQSDTEKMQEALSQINVTVGLGDILSISIVDEDEHSGFFVFQF